MRGFGATVREAETFAPRRSLVLSRAADASLRGRRAVCGHHVVLGTRRSRRRSVRYYCAYGATPDVQIHEREFTALHLVPELARVAHRGQADAPKIAAYLIAAGADPNL
mmetsp:Transcript_11389/g.35113  ORF Transcript_11389/g.35113 Transcript_11389/m.35113 type:complete len:109 (-) Transcript_11389:725-1051(-)